MRATGSHDFVLDDCRIPADRVASRRGVGEFDPRGAAGMAWFALGVAADVATPTLRAAAIVAARISIFFISSSSYRWPRLNTRGRIERARIH